MFSPSSMQDHKTLIALIHHSTIEGIQMLIDARIGQFTMSAYVAMDIFGNMLFNTNLKALGNAYTYMLIYIN